MNQADRELIRKNFMKLGDAIAPHVVEVVDYLYNVSDTISMHMRANILENNDPNHRKARKLLDIILTRGSTAFEELYTAVIEQQLFGAADILKPGKAPHGSQRSQAKSRTDEYESPDESLPDSWPSEDAFNVFKHLQKVEERHTTMMACFNKTATPKGQENTYLMSAKPRGRVLVINNEEFATLDKRDGTLQDRMAIETLFTKLGFEVQVESNKTKEDMWKLLEEESNKESHSQANCFVLFLLSHGHNGVVFGTDGRLDENKKPINCIEVKDVVDLFCGMKHLQGKPKLFFIQACQGGTKNEGESAGSADRSGAGSSGKPDATKTGSTTPGSAGDGVDKTDDLHDQTDVKTTVGVQETQPDEADVKTILNDILPTTKPDSDAEKRPSGADALVAMATLPGHLSWRNTAKGTWFVQAVAYVIAKYAYTLNLATLMTRVSNLVAKAETEKLIKQQPLSTFTMNKDFYFFPGLYESK